MDGKVAVRGPGFLKTHERAHPMDVRLLRSYAVVQIANPLVHLIE